MIDVAGVAGGLRRDIPALMAEHEVPGLAVAICDTSGVVWSEGFGVRRAGDTEPVGPRTMFGIQSVSKMYTAAAVMVAGRLGLVDLDEPVTTYLPEFTVRSRWEEEPERRITLRHLLGHTAGLTHEAPYGGNYTPGRSWTRHCESIADTWLRFPVGHHVEYSNLGIDLAAYILQRASGEPFTTFVRRHLLEPLGLERTTFVPRAIAAETGRAAGHVERSRRPPLHVPMIAAGGAYAGAEDACGFLHFHLAGGLGVLGRDRLEEMYRLPFAAAGQKEGYGLGVQVESRDGRVIRGHRGGGFGFSCSHLWSPGDGVGVVVLTNAYGHGLAEDLAQRVLRDLSGAGRDTRPTADPGTGSRAGTGVAGPRPSARPVTPADRHRLAGTYAGSEHLEIAFRAGGPVLVGGETEHTLRLTGPDELVVENAGQERFLACGDDGQGRARYLFRSRDAVTFYRNEVPDLDPDALADGPWNRTYGLTSGSAILRGIRLLRKGDDAAVELHWPGGRRAFALEEHLPGRLYFSSTGEALDLTRSPATFAGIPLRLRR